MPSHSPLSRLLARAREREFLHLALDKAALALIILMGGVVALLLAGTDILAWYWLAVLLVASVGTGAYLIRKSLSSRYVLAQRIDRKLALADAISTALYFAENPQPEKATLCESQLREAEVVATQVDVRQALPFTRSRYLAPAAALAAVAFGLFAVRYLVTGSLDLKASLVRVVYDNFFSGPKTADARNQPKRPKFEPLIGNANPDAQPLDSDHQPTELLDSDSSSESQATSGDNSKTEAKEGSQKKGDSPSTSQGKEDKSGDANNSKESNNQESGNDSKNGSQNQNGKQGGKPSSGGEKSESMLDKMRDALSNLMDKMKQSDEGSKGDQSSPQNNPGKKQDEGEKSKQPSKDQQSQASANGDQSQQAEGKDASDSSNDKKASNKSSGQDSKNGIGSQDGEKAIKQAEQLQAMGKITQILGQRSAAVSGEVMVEVGSGKQQLKTQWTSVQANHSNAGGEIHRDEIPLTEQPFIQKYFEEIRKPAAGQAPADAKKKSGDG